MTSHVLQAEGRQERHYPGEFWAKQLIAWLEKNRSQAAGKRVARLLRNMRAVTQTLEPKWVYDNSPQWGFTRRIRRALDGERAMENTRLHRTINRLLRRYRFYPEVLFGSHRELPMGWIVWWRAQRQRRVVNTPIPRSEAAAIVLAVDLARQGVIDRVRECVECGDWFFARFDHQKFCRGECQARHYRQSPEWKKHRREYMHRYRRT